MKGFPAKGFPVLVPCTKGTVWRITRLVHNGMEILIEPADVTGGHYTAVPVTWELIPLDPDYEPVRVHATDDPRFPDKRK